MDVCRGYMLESPLDVSRIPYFPPFPRLHLGKTLRNYIIPYTLYTLFISLGWLWGFERCKFLRLVRLVTNLVLETKPPRFGGVFFFQMIFWRSLSFHVIKVEFGSRRWDLDGFPWNFGCGGTMPPQLIKATWRFFCASSDKIHDILLDLYM